MKDRSAEVLPQPLLEAIAKGATVRAFPKNAIIVNEGAETASVMSINECRCVVVKRTELLSLVEKEPGFALHMVRKLASRVRDLTENVRSLALMDVYGRVARLLLDLAESRDGKLVIEETLTHRDIASPVGASRELIIRIL